MSTPQDPDRRRFIGRATRAAGTAALCGRTGAAVLSGLGASGLVTAAKAATPGAAAERALEFVHTHTGERIGLVFAIGRDYVQGALTALDRFLRDHYTGDVGRMDPQLFDLLHRTRGLVGSRAPFEVISGYRCPLTNDRLRSTGGGGVARHSLHMEGRAIDVRLPGVKLADLRDAALSLKGGGVGFYAKDGFVHLDTGRVRAW